MEKLGYGMGAHVGDEDRDGETTPSCIFNITTRPTSAASDSGFAADGMVSIFAKLRDNS